MDPRPEIDAYREATGESRTLHERAARSMPGGDTRSVTYADPYPAFVREGEGPVVRTEDGVELLDFLNNYTQAIHGHAHEPSVEAVRGRFAMGNGAGAPAREALELAEVLIERVPSLERVRFCNSGTEATMNAIRGAMAYTGRETVLKVEGGYHGTHDTVEVDLSRRGRENPGIPSSVEDRVLSVPFNDVEALTAAFEEHGDDLACFIVEPVLGAGGNLPADAAFLEAARDLTRESGSVLVFDEIVTFRLGHGGAQKRYGVTPDLTTLGKLIGGGLPVGAFGGRTDVMSVFDPEEGAVGHSGTFNGNPTTMAAGLATLEDLPPSAYARLNDLGDGLRARLREAVAASSLDAAVTGVGSMFQVHPGRREDVTPDLDAAADAETAAARQALYYGLWNEGVLVASRGMGNLSTPMGPAEVDAFVDAFEAVLARHESA